MPLGQNEFHTDTYLTNFVVGYDMQQRDSVAVRAFTPIPVMKASDKYKEISRDSWLRDEAKVRPLTGASELATYSTVDATYAAQEWGLRHMIDDRVRANSNSPLGPDEAAARFLARKMMIRRDRFWAANFFKTSVWARDRTGVASSVDGLEFLQFDQSGSDPIGVIDLEKEVISQKTGYVPNVLVMGAQVYRVLRNHAGLIGRIQYSERGIVTDDIMAALFGVDQIVVPRSIYNTAAEGLTASYDFIVGGKAMLLLYRAPVATTDATEPTAGAIFMWNGLLPGQMNEDGSVIQRRRAEREHSDEFEARSAWDQKVISADLGTYFSAAIG